MIKWFLTTLCFKIYLYFIGAVYIVKEQILKRPRVLPVYPSQAGRNIVVTGGTSGIGIEAIKKLVKLGARVIVGCRTPELAQKKFDDLFKMDFCVGSVEVYNLDLSSIKSVRSFSQIIISLDCPIHVLINNAGAIVFERKVTKDGFEEQLATNYLGHFLLSHLLLSKLKTSGQPGAPARIVNVSSCAHYCGSWMDLSDLNSSQSYSPEQVYGNSKAALIMFTMYLSNMLKSYQVPIQVLSVHPGVAFTNFYTNVTWVQVLPSLAKLVMKTAEQGGDTLVHAALDPKLDGNLATSELYLENCRPARTSSFVKKIENQVELWTATCSMLGIETFGNLRRFVVHCKF